MNQLSLSPFRRLGVRRVGILLTMLILLLGTVATAAAARPGFGELYHDGEVVRTIVPPARMTQVGRDNLYAVPDQRAVAAVAPGDTDYHGGKWAFHSVSWNAGVTPYLLTSEAAVLAAADAGDVTITRIPEMDFKCPIQP